MRFWWRLFGSREKVKAAMTGRWGKERPICKAVKYL